MIAKERVKKHREARHLQGFVRVEVIVPSESVDKLKKFASRLRSKKQKPDLDIVRTLLKEAYEKYGVSCLDNIAVDPSNAGVRQARVVSDALIKRGNQDAFLLGRRIRDEARI